MKKQLVNEKLHSFDQYEFEGNLVDVMAKLQSVTDRYPSHTNLRITMDYGWENQIEYIVRGDRLETDEECKKRTEKENKRRAASKIANEAQKKKRILNFEKEAAKLGFKISKA